VRGLLGGDRTVALRWQGRVTQVARKTIITADTAASAQITPTVIKFTTQVHYEVVQGNAAQLTLALPAAQALTRLTGDQIRDWQIKPDGDRQVLTVEFIKPVEKNYDLTIFSEQVVDGPAAASLDPPQPLEMERESGSFTISSEDMLAETETVTGLRQVDAPNGALAAYRFNSRPFTLALRVKRIEPVISTTDRVEARLEETRLVVSHHLALNVEKARDLCGRTLAAIRVCRDRRPRGWSAGLENGRREVAGEFFRAGNGLAGIGRATGTGLETVSGADQRVAIAGHGRGAGGRADWRDTGAGHPAENGGAGGAPGNPGEPTRGPPG
jgi:hypothetical protein